LNDLSKSTLGDVFLVGKETVSSIFDAEYLAHELKPDIVLIDGAYRLDPRGRSSSIWEKNFLLVKELQNAAEKTNVPWICTSQLWDDDEGKKHTVFSRRDKVKYAKEWIIDPDVTLALKQNEDLRLLNRLEIMPLKIRDAIDRKKPVYINWDTAKLDYSEVSVSTSAVSPTIIGNVSVAY
jgi:hypothetical protein